MDIIDTRSLFTKTARDTLPNNAIVFVVEAFDVAKFKTVDVPGTFLTHGIKLLLPTDDLPPRVSGKVTKPRFVAAGIITKPTFVTEKLDEASFGAETALQIKEFGMQGSGLVFATKFPFLGEQIQFSLREKDQTTYRMESGGEHSGQRLQR